MTEVLRESTPWALKRLDVLVNAYLTTPPGSEQRRHVTRAIKDLVRITPDLIDLIPGQVWVEIYRVRAAGTVPPEF